MLDGARPERSPHSQARAQAAPERAAVTAAVAAERSSPPPAAPVLTHDAVVTWLQDKEARTRIAKLLADDVESLRAAARAEGYAAGKTEGLARAKEESDGVLNTLEAMAGKMEAALQAEIAELSDQCAEIVCAALAKIAGPVLSMREAAVGTVLEVLKQLKDGADLVIRVAPRDLPGLAEREAEIERACVGRKFSLVEDTRVEAGGCIVESSLGSLDGRFDVQLRALIDTLRAAKSGPELS